MAPEKKLRKQVLGYFNVQDHTSKDHSVADKTFLNCTYSFVFQLGESMTASTDANNYDGNNLPQCYGLGSNQSIINIKHDRGHLDTVLVRFEIGAFYHLFGIPGYELVDNVQGFEDWDNGWKLELQELAERLHDQTGHHERQKIIDAFLFKVHRRAEFKKRTHRYDQDRQLFDHIRTKLRTEAGIVTSIRDLADTFNLTQRSLNYLVKKFTGIPTKQLANNYRMSNLIHLMQHQRLKMVDLIRILQYSNHYHLKQDFLKHTGIPIDSFLEESLDVARMFLHEDHTVDLR